MNTHLEPMPGYDDLEMENELSNQQIEFKKTHGGQKRAYGDTYHEYAVTSEMPSAEVESYCTTEVHKCELTDAQWKAENNSADQHFRSSYTFKKTGTGEYLYTVRFPFTD